MCYYLKIACTIRLVLANDLCVNIYCCVPELK